MIEEISADICDAIEDQPWSGFITAVAGDKIIISAGSQVGLKPGIQLNVFDSTQTIEGLDGQRFFLLGDNTAKIRLIAVTENRSEAELIDGEPVKVGSSVRAGK